MLLLFILASKSAFDCTMAGGKALLTPGAARCKLRMCSKQRPWSSWRSVWSSRAAALSACKSYWTPNKVLVVSHPQMSIRQWAMARRTPGTQWWTCGLEYALC